MGIGGSHSQEYSVAKAKRPIADYKKAAGLPEGVAELTVYYCEQAIRFSKEVGLDDGAYHDALVRMFEQALKAVMALPEARRLSAQSTAGRPDIGSNRGVGRRIRLQRDLATRRFAMRPLRCRFGRDWDQLTKRHLDAGRLTMVAVASVGAMKIASFAALGMTFLRRTIGWKDGADG